MARKAPIIELDVLKSKLSGYLKSEEGLPYGLPTKAQKDISKIEFDSENYCIGDAEELNDGL